MSHHLGKARKSDAKDALRTCPGVRRSDDVNDRLRRVVDVDGLSGQGQLLLEVADLSFEQQNVVLVSGKKKFEQI